MEPKYNVLIMTTPKDFLRLKNNYHRLVKNMPAKQLVFVGNEEVGKLSKGLNLGEQVGFIHEDHILPFSDVHKIMKDVLQREDVPRGVTGWYYQQFLKMQYSAVCEDDYYLVWDGDTIPCKPFTMFYEDKKTPYFDLKREYPCKDDEKWIRDYLQKHDCVTDVSEGFICPDWTVEAYLDAELRRGIVFGKKEVGNKKLTKFNK